MADIDQKKAKSLEAMAEYQRQINTGSSSGEYYSALLGLADKAYDNQVARRAVKNVLDIEKDRGKMTQDAADRQLTAVVKAVLDKEKANIEVLSGIVARFDGPDIVTPTVEMLKTSARFDPAGRPSDVAERAHRIMHDIEKVNFVDLLAGTNAPATNAVSTNAPSMPTNLPAKPKQKER